MNMFAMEAHTAAEFSLSCHRMGQPYIVCLQHIDDEIDGTLDAVARTVDAHIVVVGLAPFESRIVMIVAGMFVVYLL